MWLLAGCGFDEQRLVWAPDGNRAFVFGDEKVFWMDATGKLSPPLAVPGVRRVAWFSDSQRLALVTEQPLPDWAAVAREVGPEKAHEVEAVAEALWKKIQAGTTWADAKEAFDFHDDRVLMLIYRDRHPAEFKVVMREDAWAESEAKLKKEEGPTWESFARDATPEKAREAAGAIEEVWKNYRAGMTNEEWNAIPVASDTKKILDGVGAQVIETYLRARHADQFKEFLGDSRWKQEVAQATMPLYQIVLAQTDGEAVKTLAVLHHGVGGYGQEVRAAPGGRAVAFVAQTALERSPGNRLMVALTDGSGVVEIARNVATLGDWTADGRAMAYVQASSEITNSELPQLGALIVRRVFAADGKLDLEPEPKALAGVLVSSDVRVRCLRDGRILFNTAEISLPMAKADGGSAQEQLFALDPARQSTLVRLVPRSAEGSVPKSLTYFDVSPDERRVLIGSTQGEVSVLTFATGEVKHVQAAGDEMSGVPQWRNAEEFSYVKRNSEKDGVKPAHPCDLVLRRGDAETVLSASWPTEMLKLK
jgi:hypothetical protein